MGTVSLVAALALAVLFLAAWAVSLRLQDASIVDPLWGPAFVVVAAVAALVGDGDAGRRLLLLVLTGLWGLRLGAHLTRRKLADPEEDRRYAAMRARRGSPSGASGRSSACRRCSSSWSRCRSRRPRRGPRA